MTGDDSRCALASLGAIAQGAILRGTETCDDSPDALATRGGLDSRRRALASPGPTRAGEVA